MSVVHWLIIGVTLSLYTAAFTTFTIWTHRRRRPPLRRYCCGCGMLLLPGHVCVE
jgi:hypothetical protein